MKRLGVIGVAALLVGLFSVPVTPVAACSGSGGIYYMPFFSLLRSASIVVKARVLDIGAGGQTGVIEVIHYLVGSGEEDLLLVVQASPSKISYDVEDRGGPGGCGSLAGGFILGEEVYLFLTRNVDGTYRLGQDSGDMNTPALGAIRFRESQSTVPFLMHEGVNTSFPTVSVDATEAMFRDLVLEFSDDLPSFPMRRNQYPMPAPIVVTTESGATYLLPVDYAPPVLLEDEALGSLRLRPSVWRRGDTMGVTGCNVVGCTTYSPNGIDSARVTSEGVLLNDQMLVPGQGFLFSISNELIVVWNENAIDFYTMGYQRLGISEFGVNFLVSYPLQQGRLWIAQAAFSPDGTLLAYSDNDGLWLLDVYSQTARLLVPSVDGTSIATARYFSQSGRYLALTHGDERTTLNVITQTTLPDGIFSPNERFLITYESAARSSVQSICSIRYFPRCQSLPIQGSTVGRDVVWIPDDHYIYMSCESGDIQACSVIVDSIMFGGNSLGEALAFDYEPVTEMYLLVRTPYQLEITMGYYRTLRDTQIEIDEKIITAEWLPTPYYERRTIAPIVTQRYYDWLATLPVSEDGGG